MTKRCSFCPLILGLFLVLAGCNQTPNEPGPGGVSKEDARALDAAAAKLDKEPQPPAIPVPPPLPTTR
jgi:hypothetical protein